MEDIAKRQFRFIRNYTFVGTLLVVFSFVFYYGEVLVLMDPFQYLWWVVGIVGIGFLVYKDYLLGQRLDNVALIALLGDVISVSLMVLFPLGRVFGVLVGMIITVVFVVVLQWFILFNQTQEEIEV